MLLHYFTKHPCHRLIRTNVKYIRRFSDTAGPVGVVSQTFLLIRLALLAARRHPEGALSHERRAAGVKRRGDSALLLTPLFALEASSEGASNGVTQALPLVGRNWTALAFM